MYLWMVHFEAVHSRNSTLQTVASGTDLYTHATQRTEMLDALSSGNVDAARANMKKVFVTTRLCRASVPLAQRLVTCKNIV